MKFFAVVFFMFFNSFLFSQIKIPRYDSLLEIFNSKKIEKIEANRLEFKNLKNFYWWYLIPNVGYDYINQRVVISSNIHFIIEYFKNKKLNGYKLEASERKLLLDFEEEEIKLLNCYNKLKASEHQLKLIIETFENYKIYNEIKTKQHEKNEINVEEFTKEQISYLERKKNIYSFVDNTNMIISELQIIIKTNLNINLSYEIFDNN